MASALAQKAHWNLVTASAQSGHYWPCKIFRRKDLFGINQIFLSLDTEAGHILLPSSLNLGCGMAGYNHFANATLTCQQIEKSVFQEERFLILHAPVGIHHIAEVYTRKLLQLGKTDASQIHPITLFSQERRLLGSRPAFGHERIGTPLHIGMAVNLEGMVGTPTQRNAGSLEITSTGIEID